MSSFFGGELGGVFLELGGVALAPWKWVLSWNQSGTNLTGDTATVKSKNFDQSKQSQFLEG